MGEFAGLSDGGRPLRLRCRRSWSTRVPAATLVRPGPLDADDPWAEVAAVEPLSVEGAKRLSVSLSSGFTVLILNSLRASPSS